MAIAAFLPLVGIAAVVVPATIYLWVEGRPIAAVIFLVFCIGQSFFFEYGVKPRIMGSSMRMNNLLVFLSLLGGIMGFGMAGLLYGPLIMTLFLALVQLYETRYKLHIARRLSVTLPAATAADERPRSSDSPLRWRATERARFADVDDTMVEKVPFVASLKVICPKCVKGQQVVGDIPPNGIDEVCVYCKTTFKVRRPANSIANELPAAREAVPRPSDLPAAREAVPRPSDLPVSREAVPRPGDLPVSREAVPRPGNLPVSREAVPRPGDLPVAREAVPRPGDLPVSREAVPRPINLPVPKGPSFGSKSHARIQRTPSKTPPLGSHGVFFNQDFQESPESTGLDASDEIGSLNLGLPPIPPSVPKGPPDLRRPPPIPSPEQRRTASAPPHGDAAVALAGRGTAIAKPSVAPLAPAPTNPESQFDQPNSVPGPPARTPNRRPGPRHRLEILISGFAWNSRAIQARPRIRVMTPFRSQARAWQAKAWRNRPRPVPMTARHWRR